MSSLTRFFQRNRLGELGLDETYLPKRPATANERSGRALITCDVAGRAGASPPPR